MQTPVDRSGWASIWKVTFLLVATVLAGCASQPEDIGASYVSPVQYSGYSCEQLAAEMHRVSRRASELHGTLDKKADDDAAQMGVGLVLLWPTLFFLEGGDGPQAAEYARLKGEKEALEKVAIQKECGLTFTKIIGKPSTDQYRYPPPGGTLPAPNPTSQSPPPGVAPAVPRSPTRQNSHEEIQRYWGKRIEAVKRQGPHGDCDFAIDDPGTNPVDYSECLDRADRIKSLQKSMERELSGL